MRLGMLLSFFPTIFHRGAWVLPYVPRPTDSSSSALHLIIIAWTLLLIRHRALSWLPKSVNGARWLFLFARIYASGESMASGSDVWRCPWYQLRISTEIQWGPYQKKDCVQKQPCLSCGMGHASCSFPWCCLYIVYISAIIVFVSDEDDFHVKYSLSHKKKLTDYDSSSKYWTDAPSRVWLRNSCYPRRQVSNSICSSCSILPSCPACLPLFFVWWCLIAPEADKWRSVSSSTHEE